MVIMAALGAASAIGSLIGGFGKKSAADAQAKALAANARISRAATKIDVARMQRAGFQQLGNIQASTGASGLKSSGSALDVLRSSASNIAMDTALRRAQGELDARSIEMGASQAKAEGGAGLIGGIVGGATSLLSGGLF